MLDERSKDASSTNDGVRSLRPDIDNITLPVLLDGSLLNVLCAMAQTDVLSHESYDTCRSLASLRSTSPNRSKRPVPELLLLQVGMPSGVSLQGLFFARAVDRSHENKWRKVFVRAPVEISLVRPAEARNSVSRPQKDTDKSRPPIT